MTATMAGPRLEGSVTFTVFRSLCSSDVQAPGSAPRRTQGPGRAPNMRRTIWILLMLLVPSGQARAQSTTAALLDSLQHRSFLFFWNEANPTNGLIRDRSQPGSPASIAAEGFGLSAICIAIDHGWVSRADGAARVLTALQTFWNGPQGTATSRTIGYKGL